MPSYDGDTSIFGYSVSMRVIVNPTAEQRNSFFGLTGQQSLFGGLRGRVVQVQGVLYADNVIDLNAAESLIESYIDGVARVLVDTRGRAWDSVLWDRYEPAERVLQDYRGFYVPYRAELSGLV